jgi:hypothetical protein
VKHWGTWDFSGSGITELESHFFKYALVKKQLHWLNKVTRITVVPARTLRIIFLQNPLTFSKKNFRSIAFLTNFKDKTLNRKKNHKKSKDKNIEKDKRPVMTILSRKFSLYRRVSLGKKNSLMYSLMVSVCLSVTLKYSPYFYKSINYLLGKNRKRNYNLKGRR